MFLHAGGTRNLVPFIYQQNTAELCNLPILIKSVALSLDYLEAPNKRYTPCFWRQDKQNRNLLTPVYAFRLALLFDTRKC